MTKVGYVEGTCPVCGRLLIRKRPADNAVCDCFRFCPLCSPAFTVPMTPFTPDLTSAIYRNEEAQDIKGGSAEPSEWTSETLFVCYHHSPPYYSKQKPVEVHLE